MGRSAQHCRQRREEMRGKILNASISYFARHGFSGTRMGDLARSIGIAPGTIYLYFPSKEALLREICQSVQEEMLPALRVLTAPSGPVANQLLRLSSYVLTRLCGQVDCAARVVLTAQMVHGAGSAADGCRAEWEGLCQDTSLLVARGQQEGSIVPGQPEALADYYWGAAFLCARRRLFYPQAELIDARTLARVLLCDRALEGLKADGRIY